MHATGFSAEVPKLRQLLARSHNVSIVESVVQNVRHLAGNVHDNRTVRSQRFQGRDYAEPVRQRSMLQAILETKRGQTVPGGNRTAHKTGYVCTTIRAGAKATENGRTLLALRRVRRALGSGV